MTATRTALTGWEHTWPARPEHVADARRAVAHFARAAGAPERRLQALRLAVSEACANVVMHAGGAQPHTFTVTVGQPDEVVEVKVRDRGHGMRARNDSPGAGLGLGIIAELADDVEVRTPPDGIGTELRMQFQLAA